MRYAETDKMGVVYYANYFVWFEVARCDLLRGLGNTYRDLETRGVMLPVIEAHCEYRAPARYDDELEIRTRADLLSAARVEFNYAVHRPADDIALAAGRTVHAVVDGSGRPRRLPPDIRTVLARISHQPSAAAADPLTVAGRTPSRRFDVVTTTPAASLSPCDPPQRRLDVLATNPGEKCGLA